MAEPTLQVPTLQDMAREMAGMKAELAELRSRVAHLDDRKTILDCLARYARAIDRHDRELFLTCFWPDAVADYPQLVASPEKLFDFLEPRYHPMYRVHSHMICNHLCDIEGNTAHAETYAITGGLAKDATRIMYGTARYMDRLEKRGGDWRIILRCIISDTRGQLPAIYEQVAAGKWDKSDLVYKRPLTLPPERLAQLRK